MILEDYNKFGATERTAGALQNILDYQGVVAPHTGEPFTEALLMGIGGGIGAEYATWAFKSLDPKERRKARLYLRFHHVKNYVEKNEETAIRKIASRIGAKLTVLETSSREKAYKNLIECLKDGKPVIAYLSIWESLKIQREIKERFEQLPSIFGPLLNDKFVHFLPYYTLPYGWITGHLAVVYGIDEDAGLVHMADWSTQPLSITLEQLAEARAAIRGRRHATIVVGPPKKVQDLKKAIRAGIKDCYQGLLEGYTRAVRVDAWEMMAKRIANPKDKQGWPHLFDEHTRLFDALTRLHAQIAFFNCSGGALRLAYADFLEEASDVIGEPNLRDVSELFRDVASKWTDLADTALPDSIPLFKNARLATLEWNDIFISKGQSAPRQLETSVEKMKSVRNQVKESFPLSETEVMALLEDLSPRLHDIYKTEKEALTSLESVVR